MNVNKLVGIVVLSFFSLLTWIPLISGWFVLKILKRDPFGDGCWETGIVFVLAGVLGGTVVFLVGWAVWVVCG